MATEQTKKRVPVKKVKNAILYSDGSIRVSGLRFSHPHLAKKYAGKNDSGPGRYSLVGFLPKSTHSEAKDLIKTEIAKVLKTANKGADLPSDKKFLRNGVAGTESEGHWTISCAESKKRPVCKDRNKQTVELDDIEEMFYGGCWGGILLRPWFQNNDFGKRVNANLIAVQFEKNDTPFGEGRINDDDIDESFESFDDDDDDDNGGFDDDDDDDMGGL